MLDLAGVRIANTLRLFDEFKDANSPGAAPLLGLEKAFAAQLQISAAQWSQLKGGHRSIGATLARQFEARCGKPSGWLDEARRAGALAQTPASAPPEGPRDAEERFAVALFLAAYRANPAAMKARLLEGVDVELARTSKRPRAPLLRVASAPKNAKSA